MRRHPSIVVAAALLMASAVASCGNLDALTTPGVMDDLTLATSASFQVFDLGSLGGTHGAAMSISNRGEVVGFSTNAAGERRAFRWTREGGMHDLGTLGGAESAALGINQHGLVVGWSDTDDGAVRAFSWTEATGMQPLECFDDPDECFLAEAAAVNDNGIAVGNEAGTWAVRWDIQAGGVSALCDGYAYGLNNLGDIVGIGENLLEAWVDEHGDGTTTPYTGFRLLAGGDQCEPLIHGSLLAMIALDLNDGGTIVGSGERIAARDEFTITLAGPRRPLIGVGGSALFLSTTTGTAVATNEHSEVVGYRGAWRQERGFYWSRRSGLVLLPNPGAVRSAALAINDRGAVVGWRAFASGEQRPSIWADPARFPEHSLSASRAALPAAVASPGRVASEPSWTQFVPVQSCPETVLQRVRLGASKACGAVSVQ